MSPASTLRSFLLSPPQSHRMLRWSWYDRLERLDLLKKTRPFQIHLSASLIKTKTLLDQRLGIKLPSAAHHTCAVMALTDTDGAICRDLWAGRHLIMKASWSLGVHLKCKLLRLRAVYIYINNAWTHACKIKDSYQFNSLKIAWTKKCQRLLWSFCVAMFFVPLDVYQL